MSEIPVIVGVAQVEQRIDDPASGKEPLAMMIDAVHEAAADVQCPQLLTEAGSVRVVRGIWPYANPAKVVAEAIGNPTAQTALTQYGGNFVQTTMNQSCLDVQAGKHDVIVIAGKGHEREQTGAEGRVPFNDAGVVATVIEQQR